MTPSLVQGRRLGPYEILGPLGSGGMGEVYRARDKKLDRDVAIKVLPQSVAADPEALARFEREAKAVAALSHPNILAIHDFGSDNGVTYAVMELLEGDTLRDKLEEGPIPQKQAVDLAVQVARGLSAAHEKGVVHRDLKPENVFVSKNGHLKILDFGLAKRVEQVEPGKETSAPTASGHTEPGTVMGTLGYMSPEQVRGLPVDHRTDIFSFGTILYEMLFGKQAFKRGTAADTMAAILKEEPPQSTVSDRRVSPALDRVIRRCLEKDKSRRFHSAHDIAFALQDTSAVASLDEPPAPAAPAQRPRRRAILVWGSVLVVLLGLAGAAMRIRGWNASIGSLAVLPFANASSDPNVEYLNDGITDALINSFSQLPHLKVMSRDSVASYKKRDASAQVAGRELKVQAVLKGQVVQHEQDLSITAELVDVRDNTHLWGGRFNRKLSEMQAVQDEIATQVSAKLRAGLSGDEKKRLTKRYTEDPEAYQLYLKGRYFFEKRTEEQIKKSIDYFTQAIDKDPGYALAYAGLSSAYVVSTSYSYLSPGDCIPKGKAAAGRALEIDDTIAQAHATLGWSLWSYDWNFLDAEREMKRAIVLNPNDATAHLWYGLLLVSSGRTDDAVKAAAACHRDRSLFQDPADEPGEGVRLRPPVRSRHRGGPEGTGLSPLAHPAGRRLCGQGHAPAGGGGVSESRGALREERSGDLVSWPGRRTRRAASGRSANDRRDESDVHSSATSSRPTSRRSSSGSTRRTRLSSGSRRRSRITLSTSFFCASRPCGTRCARTRASAISCGG